MEYEYIVMDFFVEYKEMTYKINFRFNAGQDK
jgi:hypothetical protein